MHPSSLLSYYPTYAILDEIASYGNYKKLTVFIDLKNTLQTTYMEHAIVNIIENSKQMKFMDTSIFSSLISFLAFHKIYGLKRGIHIDFVIFFETGHSYYHHNISKSYKISRKIDDLYGLERADRELFWNVLHNNFKLIDRACNKLPGIKVVRLSHLEADFVPYYLLSRKKIKLHGNNGCILYSNDHDMLQCAFKDFFIFFKSGKNKKIIKSGNIMSIFFKKPCSYPDILLPLAMAIIGDPGDDIIGIKGIGPSRLLSVFDELLSLTGSIGEIYKKVYSGKDIFDSLPPSISNKYLQMIVDAEIKDKTISKNLKLVSFELLSRALDDPNNIEILEKRKSIEKVLEDNEVYPLNSMKEALSRTGVLLEEGSIEFLYQ